MHRGDIMEINTNDILNSILESLDHVDYIRPEEIPNIYSEDKILTKTMINNYTKNNLLPPSVKKKYSREHMLLLILIYYFKNILYKEICEMEKTRIEPMKASVREAYEKSQSAFADIEDKDARDELKLFAFICSLSFDVYLKKMMIEKIIDKLAAEPDESK